MKLDCRKHNLFIFFILQKHIVLLWLYSKVHLHLVIFADTFIQSDLQLGNT